MKNRKIIKAVSVSMALIIFSSFLLGVAKFDNTCNDLRENVLRLHILANSDNDADQQIKLKVRDELLAKCEKLFAECDGIEDAVECANKNNQLITETVNSVLRREGVNYSSSATVKQENYTTRIYDKFTLPAGKYNSVVISLGNAEGKNWWCIMYPSVCISAASDFKTIGNDSEDIATSQEKYIIKFWIVELYQKIFRLFEK